MATITDYNPQCIIKVELEPNIPSHVISIFNSLLLSEYC